MKRFLQISLPALLLATVATPLVDVGVASAAVTTVVTFSPSSIAFGAEGSEIITATEDWNDPLELSQVA
jgi:hypothetical protein